MTHVRWLLIALAGVATPLSARAGIMVVVAHPDDDVILAAGVIHAARLRGEQVTVVYMTNGELVGGPTIGLTRQSEAVAAQSVLGVNEDDLVFLGYPDHRLDDLFTDPAYAEPTAVLVSEHGQSVTFGNRGLGRADYHQHRFGAHASFNKRNVMGDLVDLVGKRRPTHVITHAEFDIHPDHRTTSATIREAMRAVATTDPTYAATLHHGLVWTSDSDHWPAAPDPTAYFTEFPGSATSTVRWIDRESIDVPRAMQSPVLELNPKHRAIDAHVSQGGAAAFIGKFVHRDEVFWSENPIGQNRPPLVDAGPSLSVIAGATVQLDGSHSSAAKGPLTYRWTQRDGATVTLTGADTARPTFIMPANLAPGTVLSFGLVVGDGAATSLEDRVTVQIAEPK